jgi:hypothetical protein
MYLHFIFRKNDNLLHHTLNKLAFFDGAEAALDGDNNLEVLVRPHLRLEQLYDLILGELDAYSRSLVI